MCVRIQSMNGVELNLFRFEYDLTWMAFFMDANDRFYTRYGGREDSDAESHLSQESLVRVMRQTLKLHQTGAVQTSRYESRAGAVRTPEDIPTMKAMLAKREMKCIHCHDVKVAQLRHRQQLDRFRRDMVFTYPAPSALGIDIDRHKQNLVSGVRSGSPADLAGIRAGDALLSAEGQRILTLGDLSRVLELTPAKSTLAVNIRRGESERNTSLALSGNWRRSEDPSWRESLHVAGPNAGLWGRNLTADQKQAEGIPADSLALEVTFIWGTHTRKAGVKTKDIVVALDGIRRDMDIRQLHTYSMLSKSFGDTMPIVVRRDGKEIEFTIRFPASAPEQE